MGVGESRPLEEVTFGWRPGRWERARCVELQAEGRACAKVLRFTCASSSETVRQSREGRVKGREDQEVAGARPKGCEDHSEEC